MKITFRKAMGFTLIELMIVVAIIGILATIAGPAFERYQSRSRQTEAKLALAAIYGNQKSFYSEYTAYIPSFDAIGYSTEGAKRFYLMGWSAAFTGTVSGYRDATYSGSVGNEMINRTGVPTAQFSLACNAQSALSTLPAANATDAQSFIVRAVGQLRSNSAGCDGWQMNELKVLVNTGINL